jgi:hypothetical protein
MSVRTHALVWVYVLWRGQAVHDGDGGRFEALLAARKELALGRHPLQACHFMQMIGEGGGLGGAGKNCIQLGSVAGTSVRSSVGTLERTDARA